MEQVVEFYDDSQVVLEGVFPAHILDPGKGKEYSGSIPHNIKFRIAPEAAEYETEYKGEKISGIAMVGQEFDHIGLWLRLKAERASQNATYKTVAEILGMKFESGKPVKVNGEERPTFKLTPLDETIVGNPVLVQVAMTPDRNNKNLPEDQHRFYPKVVKVFSWEKGEKHDFLLENYGSQEEEY